MSKDKTDEILGELHEAHELSAPETEPAPEPAATHIGQPPAWFVAFEKRLTDQVAAALYDYEEKLTKDQESRYLELRERQRGIETRLDKLMKIAYANADSLREMHDLLKQGEGDVKLRDELIKLYKELAHRLMYPETERNGGPGSV